MSALGGRTIVVTRPRGDGNALAQKLTKRGARPVLFPTIDIQPVADFTGVDRELTQVAGYDWLVFTSAHAVAHTWSRLQVAGITLPKTLRVAAIGPATERALGRFGVRVDIVPREYRGSALPEALGDLNGLRILMPVSDIGGEDTASGLRNAGAAVTEVIVYCTVPVEADEEGLAVLRTGADAVTFTSPSTVRNFAALVGSETPAVLERAVVACIGPTTADAVIRIGVEHALVAAPHTADGLIDLLDDHFSARVAESRGA